MESGPSVLWAFAGAGMSDCKSGSALAIVVACAATTPITNAAAAKTRDPLLMFSPLIPSVSWTVPTSTSPRTETNKGAWQAASERLRVEREVLAEAPHAVDLVGQGSVRPGVEH